MKTDRARQHPPTFQPPPVPEWDRMCALLKDAGYPVNTIFWPTIQVGTTTGIWVIDLSRKQYAAKSNQFHWFAGAREFCAAVANGDHGAPAPVYGGNIGDFAVPLTVFGEQFEECIPGTITHPHVIVCAVRPGRLYIARDSPRAPLSLEHIRATEDHGFMADYRLSPHTQAACARRWAELRDPTTEPADLPADPAQAVSALRTAWLRAGLEWLPPAVRRTDP